MRRPKRPAIANQLACRHTRDGQTSVFVVKGDTVEMRQVKLGLSQDGTVEMTSGVEAGEEVVVAGQNDLRDGDKVEKK